MNSTLAQLESVRTSPRRPQNLAELMRYSPGTLVMEVDYGPLVYNVQQQIDQNMISFISLDQVNNLGQIVIDKKDIEFNRGLLTFHGMWDVSPITLNEDNSNRMRSYAKTIKGAEL